MKKILIILSLIIILSSCNNKEIETDIYQIMEENEHIIVDVRTPEEYNESHIEGAINIPHDQINENIDLDKNKIIVVYCMSGARSNMAYKTLSTLGYEVYDLGPYANIKLPKTSINTEEDNE